MATLSIQRRTQRTFSLKEWTKVKGTSINAWLHGRSEFYSRICDFSVTRLLVIRIHLVFLCIIGTVLTVEHHPLLSVVFALCAAYWGHRVNRLDKEGGAL